MALIKKILLAVVIVCILIFFSLIVFFRYQGKLFIERKASAVFNRPLTVENAKFVFPVGIELSNVNVPELFFAESVLVKAGPSLFWGNLLSLDEVTLKDAVLTMHRDKDNHIQLKPTSSGDDKNTQTTARASAKRLQAVIRNLNVTNGKIIFPGHDQPGAVDIYLHDVQITAQNVALSGQEQDSQFKISGRILDNQNLSTGNDFKGAGWFNWPKRSMNADASVLNWHNQFDVNLKAVSVNNEMKVNGHMISRGNPAAAPDDQKNQPADLLANIMRNASMAIDMNFSFSMKMDRWELSNVDFSGNLSASIGGENSISGK